MRKLFRWLPAVLAPVVVAGAIAVPVAIANATPNLPQRTATQIIALAAHGQRVKGFSGDYSQVSNLGLPAIPADLFANATPSGTNKTVAEGGGEAAAALSNTLMYLSADQRGRISVGETGIRIQSYAGHDEQDTVLTRGSLWLWDSKTQHATHIKLPALTAAQEKKLDAMITLATPEKPVYTPQQLANIMIRDLDEHTRLTVGKAQYVAGRGAYTLVFTPREQASLVRDIRVNIDGKTGMALRVGVYAKNMTDPAYQLGYTSLSYSEPNSSTFRFTPAPGMKVTTQDYTPTQLRKKYQTENGHATKTDLSQIIAGIPAIAAGLGEGAKEIGDTVTVAGAGWAGVVHVVPSKETRELVTNKQVRGLTTAGPNNSRVLSTTLFNIMLGADGSITFGSVPVADL